MMVLVAGTTWNEYLSSLRVMSLMGIHHFRNVLPFLFFFFCSSSRTHMLFPIVSHSSIITEFEGFLSSFQRTSMSGCGTIIASLISTSVRRSKRFCTRWSSQRISKNNKRRKEACKESKMERDRERSRDSICPSLVTCFHLPFVSSWIDYCYKVNTKLRWRGPEVVESTFLPFFIRLIFSLSFLNRRFIFRKEYVGHDPRIRPWYVLPFVCGYKDDQQFSYTQKKSFLWNVQVSFIFVQ